MDTTETNIKMRLAAIPDMGQGVPPGPSPDGVWYLAENVWVDDKGDVYHSTEDVAVCLERQDQLQEMVIGHPYEKMERCWNFATQDEHGWYFDSAEQLWLAFVMKELHDKIWTGHHWA